MARTEWTDIEVSRTTWCDCCNAVFEVFGCRDGKQIECPTCVEIARGEPGDDEAVQRARLATVPKGRVVWCGWHEGEREYGVEWTIDDEEANPQ